jgi:hypothetical protein
LLQCFERDGLLTILQTKEAGGGDSELFGEGSIRDLSSPFPQEHRQLRIQRLPHEENGGQKAIPFAEYFACLCSGKGIPWALKNEPPRTTTSVLAY